jgi:lipopolysaccharide/colanic/teichoic acid biosynthesis glycosyltransferase
VFFVQDRIGRNGQAFRMIKFRTMVADAEKRLDGLVSIERLNEPVFKIKNDPRLTKVGKFLRRTSIDELPQIFNVLKGDMSLVGPRPEERRVVARYDYRQRQRLAVRPGITGPMQVNGRGDLQFERRLALELEYIRNYSLFRDLELIVKTIPTVLLGKGAY